MLSSRVRGFGLKLGAPPCPLLAPPCFASDTDISVFFPCLPTPPSLSPVSLLTMSRSNQWFVIGDGIAREVITADIQRYLGPDALVRPGLGTGEYEVRPSCLPARHDDAHG